jgi:hypothetical protein
MRKQIILFIGLAALIIPNLVQSKDLIWDEEGISNATLLLFQKINNDKVFIGSGTIVTKGDRYFILTASHVSKELKNDAKIVFRLLGDKPQIVDLLPIAKNKSLNWKQHPIADIALLELEIFDESIRTLIKNYAFPDELIHRNKELPQRGADLTFLGYPVLDLDMEHFSPLIFTAYRSSGLITQKRADTKTKCNFYYLNEPSIQGCSGSGVFLSVRKSRMFLNVGRTLMIGIVHGTHGDNTGGKLAAITPSYYILDLFED